MILHIEHGNEAAHKIVTDGVEILDKFKSKQQLDESCIDISTDSDNEVDENREYIILKIKIEKLMQN